MDKTFWANSTNRGVAINPALISVPDILVAKHLQNINKHLQLLTTLL